MQITAQTEGHTLCFLNTAFSLRLSSQIGLGWVKRIWMLQSLGTAFSCILTENIHSGDDLVLAVLLAGLVIQSS